MARPKTLSASWVPIIVATSLVYAEGVSLDPWISVFAILSATFIQIATNFFNDALDFVKGADDHTRLGESRASQNGWLSVRMVFLLGGLCLLLAVGFGLPLVVAGGWPILIVGLISLVLAYAYTGGPYPLAYLGLGDLFVILFFGVIAVGGVYYLHANTYSMSALISGLQIGLTATVLIAINNLRDIESDRRANKLTLSARLGYARGRWEIPVLFALTFLLGLFWIRESRYSVMLAPIVLLPLVFTLVKSVLRTPPSVEYNGFLALAARIQMLFGIILSLALVSLL